ncbi:motility associated factor glycosyltransferase family protein [Sulfurimonas sp. SAG-AH-194-C21]|nr:6-hydroxymethylpterin diphosphokinase MptE-like protein [Sulfurimonas sp. SAG-AH-194-C21]MDF1884394.1 motility associated factor glycosyltransferase family protein [Sulfurimonas sp. SAG-AH-194-C21]
MPDINTEITTNFTENIEYIQKKHPLLFKKISELDNAIANGYYQDRYELVYENDGFDVYEKSTDTYLYAKESLAHTLISENRVNFRCDEDVFEAFVEHSSTSNEKNAFVTNHLEYILPITEYIEINSTDEKELLSIDKFIFFGVGLGLHIPKIHNKISSKIYLIIEDDLELFRLSLFTCNYMKLAKEAELVFSVFESKNEFTNTSAIFLDLHYEYNHYLKMFHLSSHTTEKIDEFSFAISAQPHIRFLFTNLLLQYTQPLNYLFSDYTFLDKSLSFKDFAFKKIPFLLLASGPSLEENIQWLKENKSKFITIAASSSLAFLEEHDIVPNIIIHIDPFEWGIISFKKLKSLSFIENSLALFSATTSKNIISLISKKNLFLFETGTHYKKNSFKLSSPCVGSLAYQLLILLKVQKIYLLGLDLAVSEATGKTHSGSHQEKQELKILDTKQTAYKTTLMNIQGNKKDIVQTTSGFYSSWYIIENYTTQFLDKTQTVFNLGNGARFSKTLPSDTESLQLSQDSIPPQIMKDLTEFFHKDDSTTLVESERASLQVKLRFALHLRVLFKQKFNTIEEYLNFLYTEVLIDKLLEKSDILRVLNTYLHYILSYIFDFTNHFNSPKDIKELLIILNQNNLKILQKYIDTLEESFKG